MDRREIASAMARLGAESLAAHVLGDPVLTPRHGFAVARREGLWCFTSRRFDLELFKHVSGYGTFAEPSQRAIDTVVRHYERAGRAATIEVFLPTVSRADRALLERNGFRDHETLFECHVRTSTRPPRQRSVSGLTITRVRRAEGAAYGALASRGFGDRGGPIGMVFQRACTPAACSGASAVVGCRTR